MGDSAEGHLAYGINLGSPGNNGWKLAGVDEYGDIDFDWCANLDEFPEAATGRLVHAAGFVDIDGEHGKERYRRYREFEMGLPVVIRRSGHFEVPGWVLVAVASEDSAEWTDVLTLDLDALRDRPTAEGWDAKLAAAVAALGITPTQDRPRWLVYPSYG